MLEKYYKSLSSQIIGFAKFTCIQILTHLITEYVELEDDDIQDIYQRMKEPISGENIFEEFIKKMSGIKKRSRCIIRIHQLRLSP